MERPDLDTLAYVHRACQRFRLTGEGNLTVRIVYGHDRIRLLRCRTCGEEFSERRGTALFNTQITEEKAEAVSDHVGEGCGMRATARLVHISKDTVAERAEAGDMWDHTAIAADSKLRVSLVVGTRTQAQTTALVRDATQRRRPGHLPAIFTDASDGYASAILDAFGRHSPVLSASATGRSRRSMVRWPQR